MKRIYTLIMLVALAMSCWAQVYDEPNLSFEVTKEPTGNNAGEVIVTGLSDEGRYASNLRLVIPQTTVDRLTTKAYRVTGIAEMAFRNATNITSVSIPEGVEFLGSGYAFLGCTGLDSVSVQCSKILPGTFGNCSSLHDVQMTGVKRIEGSAFSNCTSLTSITIPKSVQVIHGMFVDDCPKLAEINVDSENTHYTSRDKCLYSKDLTLLVRVPEAYKGAVDYPSTLTTVGASSHQGCNFTSIRLKYGVTTIRYYAFSDCKNLREVEIPSSVQTIDNETFKDSGNITRLSVNATTAPTIQAGNLFGNISAATTDLYVPRGKESDYQSAGWTGFKSYNQDGVVARDLTVGGLDFTVTKLGDESFAGLGFNGRAKVVCGWNHASVAGEVTIPDRINVGDRALLVTRIDDYAFKTDNEFSVIDCEAIDTVGSYAFSNAKLTSIEMPNVKVIERCAFATESLTNVQWGYSLKEIGTYAFSIAPIENNIFLPVGFEKLGYRAFELAKSKVILIPSTTQSVDPQAFNKMRSLETIIVNSPALLSSGQEFTFTDVPRSAKVFVPVGQAEAAKAHKNWKRFTNIEVGAFDFCREGDLNSEVKITVVDNTPLTVDGMEYDGKAKYVYSPQILVWGAPRPENSEIESMNLGGREYLMTEVGDSLCYAGPEVEFKFERMTHLERIGRKAFCNSELETAVLPDRKIEIGEDAFYGATYLTELVIPCQDGFEGTARIFGNNDEAFTCYVNNVQLPATLQKMNTQAYSDTEKCGDRLAPCFTANAGTLAQGAVVPLDFKEFNAYIVTGLSSTSGKVNIAKVPSMSRVGEGVILAGLTTGEFYKIPRYKGAATPSATNYLKANCDVNSFNVAPVAGGYYWDAAHNRFVNPTSSSLVRPGHSYLEIQGGTSRLELDFSSADSKRGDVNSDGTVDVTDVNLAINVMLGKATKAQYPASDVNGDGTVDVSDVNLIINIMLGR